VLEETQVYITIPSFESTVVKYMPAWRHDTGNLNTTELSAQVSKKQG